MRLALDARARRWLRGLSRVKLYSAAELLLLALLALQCARLIWTIVTPYGPLGPWRPAVAGFAGSPRALLAGYDPFGGPPAAAVPGNATVTAMKLTLFGTRIDSAGGRGSAIIAGPDGMQKSIAVGEEVAPGVVLKAVAFDHVTLDHAGASEELYLDQSGAAPGPALPPPAAGAPLMAAPPAATVPNAPSAPTAVDLRSQIQVIPRIDDGRFTGVTVRPSGSGDAFRAAGLQPGDVITRINGRALASPTDAGEAIAGIAPGSLSLTVERGGQTIPLSVTVARQ